MSVNRIPNEILSIIIKHISNSFTDVRFNSDMLKCSTISSRWTSLARDGLYRDLTFENDDQAVAWIESECTQRMEYSTRSLCLGDEVTAGIASEVVELLRVDEEMGGIKKLEIEMEETFDSRNFRSEKLRDLKYLDLQGPVGPITNRNGISVPFSFKVQELWLSNNVIIQNGVISHLFTPSLKKLDTIAGDPELGIQTFDLLHLTPNLLSYDIKDCAELWPHQIANLKHLESFSLESHSNPTSLLHLFTLCDALPSQSLTNLSLYLHHAVTPIAITRLIKILHLDSMKSLKKLKMHYFDEVPVMEKFDQICRGKGIEVEHEHVESFSSDDEDSDSEEISDMDITDMEGTDESVDSDDSDSESGLEEEHDEEDDWIDEESSDEITAIADALRDLNAGY